MRIVKWCAPVNARNNAYIHTYIHTHALDGEGRIGRIKILLLARHIGVRYVRDVLASLCGRMLAFGIYVYLPQDTWLLALPRHTHEFLRCGLREGRGEISRNSKHFADLVEAFVLIR